jgi:hypothetical protein
VPLSTVDAISDRFFAFSRKHPDADTKGSFLLFEGFSNARYCEVPARATAFNSRGDYYNIGFAWTWDDPALDAEVRSYNSVFQREARGLGYNDSELKDGVGIDLNYMNSGTFTAKDAFGGNGARVAELKKKYDPDNLFDKLWKLLPRKEEQWAA